MISSLKPEHFKICCEIKIFEPKLMFFLIHKANSSATEWLEVDRSGGMT